MTNEFKTNTSNYLNYPSKKMQDVKEHFNESGYSGKETFILPFRNERLNKLN